MTLYLLMVLESSALKSRTKGNDKGQEVRAGCKPGQIRKEFEAHQEQLQEFLKFIQEKLLSSAIILTTCTLAFYLLFSKWIDACTEIMWPPGVRTYPFIVFYEAPIWEGWTR